MIDTVLFDMGGTLEDIWVDDESRHSSIQGVLDNKKAALFWQGPGVVTTVWLAKSHAAKAKAGNF